MVCDGRKEEVKVEVKDEWLLSCTGFIRLWAVVVSAFYEVYSLFLII